MSEFYHYLATAVSIICAAVCWWSLRANRNALSDMVDALERLSRKEQ